MALALDGMQSLPGSDTPQNKGSLFYQTLRKVCILINQISTQLALADSPQKRNIIPLALVRDVRRDGKPVFDWRGNACLELLQNDMGGQGRALEAL